MRFPNGALGTLSATTCAFPGYPTEIRLTGTLGTAVLTDSLLNAAFHDGSRLEAGRPSSAGGAGADPMAFDHANHRALIVDFLDAMKTGRSPKISGADALRSHALIDAVLAAARSGGRENVAAL